MYIPARNQDHVVSQVFTLDLGLLHDNDVGLEDVEHGLGPESERAIRGARDIGPSPHLEAASLRPWLV